jgi:hypothetical protein
MSHVITLDPRTAMALRTFIKNGQLCKIEINENHGIDHSKLVSDVDIYCLLKQGGDETFKVSFKLQNEGHDACLYFKAIDCDPKSGEFTIHYQPGVDKDFDADCLLNLFVELTKPRIKEAHREQEIQSIVFVGNTFWINGTTKFKVLSDDGEGRLTIELLSGSLGQGSDELLSLSSHGLLDGLYLGMIKVA